jgi:glucose/arabinose dehydrogenase
MGQISLQQVFTGRTLAQPTELVHAGDSSGRIFVVHKTGIIRIHSIYAPNDPAKVFLNISSKVVAGSELGLLGLAFHPNFKENGYFYVNYTAQTPLRTVISRYQISPTNPDSAIASSEVILLTFAQPASNHNGGKMLFGPEGYLYIATGDGGGANDIPGNSQNLSSYLGKIIRIDVDSTVGSRNYGIPADNPFWNIATAKHEVFAYGLRNPWRFSYDKETNRFWIGDVGQGAYEEVDTLVKGGNYGWRMAEGTHCTSNAGPLLCTDPSLIKPIYDYFHGSGNISITGGYVYRGPSAPSLTGKYIFGDYNSGRIWSLQLRTDSTPLITQIAVSAWISTFGVDENGDLYTLNHTTGGIYKIRDNATSIKSKDLLKDVSIRVLPNPAKTEIMVYVKGTSTCGGSIEIRDVEGKVLKKATLQIPNNPKEEATLKLNVSDLASGSYTVSQPCGGAARSTKFIIAR